MKQIRIAVVGAGQFGRKHMETVHEEPMCELVAVADPAYAGEMRYSDYREMLDRAEPDGVIVATPNALHVPVALACVERRVPVLVEKPIADSVAASRELVDAAERAGGPLLINLIHDIDDLRFVCVEITEVRAMTANGARGFAVEDTAAVTLRFANGALGTATVSDAVAAPWSWELTSGENPAYPRQHESCYLFCGTEGSLALPGLQLHSYGEKKGWHAPLSHVTLQVNGADPQARQLQHFCRVIRGKESPRVSGADALQTLAAVQAVRDAAVAGRPVQL